MAGAAPLTVVEGGRGAVTPPRADESHAGSPQSPREEELSVRVQRAGRLLTAAGEDLGKEAEGLRGTLAYFETGTLLVLKGQERSIPVRSFVHLLERVRRVYQVAPVDAATIQEVYRVYERTRAARKTTVSAVQVQQHILAMIKAAANEGASDIHIEVSDIDAKVEFREDGLLIQKTTLPGHEGQEMCAALYAMADPGTTSHANDTPTDHQFARISSARYALPEGVQALRVQMNPLSYGGRHVALRLLYKKSGVDGDIVDLGFLDGQVELIEEMCAVSVGFNVFCGPTGSGKTTTLERILRRIKLGNPHLNVISVEDPPEFVIPGVRQIPLTGATTPEERKTRMTRAIIAVLRSDPDVFMIGETRDGETAKLVFEGAMSGHQTWTTTHANDAVRALPRLLDMGVESWKLFDPGLVRGLVAQRLVRVLCLDCSVGYEQGVSAGLIAPSLLERVIRSFDDPGTIRVARPGGCPRCRGRVYAGRRVVAEVVRPDEAFMALMARCTKEPGKVQEARQYWLREMGGVSMMEHGLAHVSGGVTSPHEIERVLEPITRERR